MSRRSLDDWLDWQLQHHPKEIDLGLERVREVAQRAALLQPRHRLITVGGTNGKGSSVAMLESILATAGVSTGSYTSPHIHRYNERIKLDGQAVDDARLCAAFEAIDAAREGVSLSFFEWGTLAAMYILQDAQVDVGILEVGLGGRLDAVNILDADVALVTSIGIDHTDWLGDSREAISLEKLGIGRAGKPLICSDPHPPAVFVQEAQKRGIPLQRLGHEFTYGRDGEGWYWQGEGGRMDNLPMPGLAGEHQLQNASGVLAALQAVPGLDVAREAVAEGLRSVRMMGRFEQIKGDSHLIFDVAHNEDSGLCLRDNLRAETVQGETWCLLAMLKDKDFKSMISTLSGEVGHWLLTSPDTPRALETATLAQAVKALATEETSVLAFESIQDGLEHALEHMDTRDRLLITGSFFTVAEARALIQNEAGDGQGSSQLNP